MTYRGAQRIAVTMVLAQALQLDRTAFVIPNGPVIHVQHQLALLARKLLTKSAVAKENVWVESANAKAVILAKIAVSKSAQGTALAMVNAKTGHVNVLPDGRVFLAIW